MSGRLSKNNGAHCTAWPGSVLHAAHPLQFSHLSAATARYQAKQSTSALLGRGALEQNDLFRQYVISAEMTPSSTVTDTRPCLTPEPSCQVHGEVERHVHTWARIALSFSTCDYFGTLHVTGRGGFVLRHINTTATVKPFHIILSFSCPLLIRWIQQVDSTDGRGANDQNRPHSS